jgi:HEAT repeat protein
MIGIEKSDLITDFTCGSDKRAEEAALRLAAAGSLSFEILKELLSDTDADIRWWATRTLAEIRAPESISLLLQALHDPLPAVQQCAAVALRHQADSKAIPQLIDALSSSDRLLARLAGDALIAVGKDAVPTLIEIAEGKSQPARLEAIRGLSLIGDNRAIPVLFTVEDEDSAIIGYYAAQGLERMGVGMVYFNP